MVCGIAHDYSRSLKTFDNLSIPSAAIIRGNPKSAHKHFVNVNDDGKRLALTEYTNMLKYDRTRCCYSIANICNTTFILYLHVKRYKA